MMNAEEQEAMQKQIEMVEQTVKHYLSKEALMRYGTLKAAHPEKAMRTIAVLAQLIQNKQISESISDEELKEVLRRLDPQRQETRIRRI